MRDLAVGAGAWVGEVMVLAAVGCTRRLQEYDKDKRDESLADGPRVAHVTPD